MCNTTNNRIIPFFLPATQIEIKPNTIFHNGDSIVVVLIKRMKSLIIQNLLQAPSSASQTGRDEGFSILQSLSRSVQRALQL